MSPALPRYEGSPLPDRGVEPLLRNLDSGYLLGCVINLDEVVLHDSYSPLVVRLHIRLNLPSLVVPHVIGDFGNLYPRN